MKTLFFLIFILPILSCSNPNRKAKVNVEYEKSKKINDSVYQLIVDFQTSNDTILLERSLVLLEESTQLNKTKQNQIHCLNIKGTIVGLLGRYWDAFCIREQVVNLTSDRYQQLLCSGIKNEVFNRTDSAHFYLTSALKICNDSLSSNPKDFNMLVNKIEVLLYLKEKDIAVQELSNTLKRNLDNPAIFFLKDSLDNMDKEIESYLTRLKYETNR